MQWELFGAIEFNTMQNPKILITRTSPELDLEPILEAASDLFSNATLDVLKGSRESDLAYESQWVNSYFHYEGLAWSQGAMTPELTRQLKGSAYDILVLGVGSEWRDRALSLKLFAWRMGIASIVLIDEHGIAKSYARSTWLLRSIYVETVWRLGYRILVEQDEKLALTQLKLVPVRRKLARKKRSGKVRVAVVTYSLGVGGVQKQIVELAGGIDRDKYELRVYLLMKEEAFFEPALRKLGVPVEYLYESAQPMLLFRKMGAALAARLTDYNPHVIHSYMNYPSVVACLAAAKIRPDVLITSIRTLTGKGASFYTWHGENCRQLDRSMVLASDVVIGNSKSVIDDYADWTGLKQEKMQVVYNGIDSADFDAVTPEQIQALRESLELGVAAPVVLIVGRLSVEKDQATFCRSIERVQRAFGETCGILVGEGPAKSVLRTEFKELEDRGALVFAGNRKDIPLWMHLADVVVLSSKIEGLPNVLIEAAWASTPVVTTACGGGEEVVEDGVTGFVVPVGDDEAAAGRILELLQDKDGAAKMGRAARLRAERLFSPDKMVADTTRFYGEP